MPGPTHVQFGYDSHATRPATIAEEIQLPLLEILEGTAGVAVVAAMLLDVFVTVVVPRRSSRTGRLSVYLVRGLWSVWRALGLRVRSSSLRESFLGTFGALAV